MWWQGENTGKRVAEVGWVHMALAQVHAEADGPIGHGALLVAMAQLDVKQHLPHGCEGNAKGSEGRVLFVVAVHLLKQTLFEEAAHTVGVP